MILAELLEWAKPVRERIRASENSEAVNVETRLDISARHVAASRLGEVLYEHPEALAVWASGATVQTAALMMVFANGQTSIDLCATALLRWHGDLPRPGFEHDFGDLQRRLADGRVTVSTDQREWFKAVAESDAGAELLDFRHAILHRVVGQSATVRPGGQHSYTISPTTAQPGNEEATVTLGRLAQFAEDRWHQFWQALSFDVPGG